MLVILRVLETLSYVLVFTFLGLAIWQPASWFQFVMSAVLCFIFCISTGNAINRLVQRRDAAAFLDIISKENMKDEM